MVGDLGRGGDRGGYDDVDRAGGLGDRLCGGVFLGLFWDIAVSEPVVLKENILR